MPIGGAYPGGYAEGFGLDEWFALDPGDRSGRRVCCIGSSTTQGTVGITNRGWTEELRLLMQPRWGKGGIGLVQVFREGWSFTTGANAWTNESSGAVSDAGSSAGAVTTAALATCIGTYTVSATGGVAYDGFYLYFVDKVGSGTPSYSIDGAAFVNVPGVTFTGSNQVKRSSLISTAYTTTVRVRAGNAAGTNQQVSLHGIEPVDLTGYDRGGCVVDNFGRNSDFLASAARGAGNPLLRTLNVTQPNVVTVMYTNDLLFWPSQTPPGNGQFFTDNLEFVLDVTDAIGANLLPMVYFARGDVDTPSELVDQDDLRARVHAFADLHSLPVVDCRDDFPTYADASAAGMIVGGGDVVHPSTAGTQYIANQVWHQLSHLGSETFVRVP